MKWFLVFYVCSSVMPDMGSSCLRERLMILDMPSREVCEQVVALNKFINTQCWGKPS